jgi:hypothetical protein
MLSVWKSYSGTKRFLNSFYKNIRMGCWHAFTILSGDPKLASYYLFQSAQRQTRQFVYAPICCPIKIKIVSAFDPLSGKGSC